MRKSLSSCVFAKVLELNTSSLEAGVFHCALDGP
jgi:hypothetical protein